MDEMNKLTNSILSQAKYFLDDAGEFYPFATVIDGNKNIKPVGIYFGKENPDPTEVLKRLEDTIRKGIERKDYICAAIGVDIYINVKKEEGDEKKEALEIRLYAQNTYTVNRFHYYKKDGEFYFKPILL